MRVLVYNTGIVRNELICGYANVLHTSSSFRPHTHTHAHTHARMHILIPSEDRESTGLKVDIAGNSALYKVFKVLLSFSPLGARKRSYVRTRHSL